MVKRKLSLWCILNLATISCICCLDDSSLIFVHTEDTAEFSLLSFSCSLFILTHGLCSRSIMNYLLFSFAAAWKAEKFLSEVKIPALIALNSTLLIPWSSAASPDAVLNLLKELQVGPELQPLLMLKNHCGSLLHCGSSFPVTSLSGLQ